MKRSAWATLLLATSILAHPVTAGAEHPFPDVLPSSPMAEEVRTLALHGIFAGFPDGRYCGEREVTRYEACVAFWRLQHWWQIPFSCPPARRDSRSRALTLPRPLPHERFRDVPDKHWAREYADHLARDGVFVGIPGGAFEGNRLITRSELAAAEQNIMRYMHISLGIPTAVDKAVPPPIDRRPVTRLQLAEVVHRVMTNMRADLLRSQKQRQETSEPGS